MPVVALNPVEGVQLKVVPLPVTVKVVELPLHIATVGEFTVNVGVGLTVTELVAACAIQLPKVAVIV